MLIMSLSGQLRVSVLVHYKFKISLFQSLKSYLIYVFCFTYFKENVRLLNDRNNTFFCPSFSIEFPHVSMYSAIYREI